MSRTATDKRHLNRVSKLPCATCGVTIVIPPSRIGRRKYCSRRCYSESQKGKKIDAITTEVVRELFDYVGGVLYWRVTKGNSAKAGWPAGSKDKDGYLQTVINRKAHKNHRLIWLWHGFELPEFLDHIDNDTSNNQIENLRPADKRQNAANSKINSRNTSGFKGVSRFRGKWRAVIQQSGRSTHIGTFNTREEASAAYMKKATELYGEYARAK